MVTSGSQLSVAVGEAGGGTNPHWAVSSAGTPANTGAWVSPTEIVCVPCAVLPQLSTAVQVRMRVYESAQAPGVVVSFRVMVTSVSQLSVAVGETGAGTDPHWAVLSAGIPDKTGAWVSLTDMICVPSAE